jgi:hypothetical protein
MGRSKYPRELDTSVEIPPVRDNILEVGSDVINSLRSAIFQIERTLGINPQGAVGNTLADRINKSLDGNGNILSDALDKANVLSGPITDSDVSKVAAIQESKLRLSVPTGVLQTQVTDLDGQLGVIIDQLTELSTAFAVHVNAGAVGRHPATAISVAGSAADPSLVAASDLPTGSTQSVLEEIYNAHINFDGIATSLDENSHFANQIYFDNSIVTDFTDADDVQEALEDIALSTRGTEILHQDLFHANGLLRAGKIDTPDNVNVGPILADEQELFFLENDANISGITRLTFNSPVDIGDFELLPSDIITISDISDTENVISGSFEIAEVFLDTSGDVLSVDVYHIFSQDSTSSTLARLSKNINSTTNEASLLLAIKEKAGLTSATNIQVCNPNAVRIISNEIRPSAVTSINRFFNLSIDGGSDLTLDVYSGTPPDRQTVDSIASRLNEQFEEQAIPAMAYRLDQERGMSELVIAHNLPDEDGELHTLKVSSAIDDGLSALGLSGIEDIEVSSVFGSSYYISGIPYSGLKEKLDTTDLTFFVSTNLITANSSSINFLDLGIKIGDVVTISEAPTDTDNGTYLIVSLNESQMGIDSDQLPTGFAAASEVDTRFRIFNNVVSFSELTFDEVSGTFGAALVDVFMNNSQELFFKKRLEYRAEISGFNESLITVVDFTGDIADKQLEIVATEGTDGVIITIDSGDSVEIYGKDSYVWVTSGSENISLKLFIQDAGTLVTAIGGGSLQIDVFGFNGVNEDTNLLLGRVAYGSFKGRIIGGSQAPRSLSKLARGNVGIKEIGSSAKHALLERPLNELRANGIVYGLEVINPTIDGDGFYNFDVTRGVCYVEGRRYEMDAISGIITDIVAVSIDKIFISIDENGNIVFEPALTSCISPFGDGENCPLSSLEYDNTTVEAIDLRLLIDELDLKLLNSVTVSPQPKLGHFQTIQKAIKYAKRFTELFPKAGVPTVHLKSGTYEVTSSFIEARDFATWSVDIVTDPANELKPFYDGIIRTGIFIDFPINITGEGDSTIIKARSNYDFSDPVSYSFRGVIAIAGDSFIGTTIPSISQLSDGMVTISNLKLDNCKIQSIDSNTRDLSTSDPLNFVVNIDNVILDHRDFAGNPFDDGIGPIAIEIAEVSNNTDEKGNIIIRNCKFIDSNIKVIPSRVNNMLVAHNMLLGEDTNTLFSDELGIGNPFDFIYAQAEANITIVGNIHSGNNTVLGATGPKMAPDISADIFRWGERFSRDVNVGGDINLLGNIVSGGNGDFEGAINGDSYAYNDSVSRTKYVFFDEIARPGLGASSPDLASFAYRTISSRRWNTIKMTDVNKPDEFCRFRIELLPGETLTSMSIFYTGDGNTHGQTYQFQVKSEDAFMGNRQTELSKTSTTAHGDGPDGAGGSLLGNLSIVGENDRFYWVEINREASSGSTDEYLFYFSYEVLFDSVEVMGGAG